MGGLGFFEQVLGVFVFWLLDVFVFFLERFCVCVCVFCFKLLKLSLFFGFAVG